MSRGNAVSVLITRVIIGVRVSIPIVGVRGVERVIIMKAFVSAPCHPPIWNKPNAMTMPIIIEAMVKGRS